MFGANLSEIENKQFNVRYSCEANAYERFILVGMTIRNSFFDNFSYGSLFILGGSRTITNETKNWESCHFLSSNIFRKEERDWKMVYLARAEDTDTASIAWKFDFSNENLIIDTVSIKFETKTYENGVVDLQILNENGKCGWWT